MVRTLNIGIFLDFVIDSACSRVSAISMGVVRLDVKLIAKEALKMTPDSHAASSRTSHSPHHRQGPVLFADAKHGV